MALLFAVAAVLIPGYAIRMSRSAELERQQIKYRSRVVQAAQITLGDAAAYEAGTPELPDGRSSRSSAAEVENAYYLFREYSYQKLAQSKLSFRVSLIAGGFGYAAILMGAGVAIFTQDLVAGGLPIIAGVVTNAGTLLFHSLDSKTQVAVANIFDQIRRERSIDEALALAKSIEDPRVAASVQAALALHLAGIQELDSLHARVSAQDDSVGPDPKM